MTDIMTALPLPQPTEEEIRQDMELLFYAYRDYTAEADAVLARHRLGRAHHRALYFIGRNPGITVSALLTILRITKQSLARVLGDLVRLGLVVQRTRVEDRRRRHLELTDAGAELEHHLMERQRARMIRAYGGAGADAVAGYREVLLGMVNDADRRRLRAAAPSAHRVVRRTAERS